MRRCVHACIESLNYLHGQGYETKVQPFPISLAGVVSSQIYLKLFARHSAGRIVDPRQRKIREEHRGRLDGWHGRGKVSRAGVRYEKRADYFGVVVEELAHLPRDFARLQGDALAIDARLDVRQSFLNIAQGFEQ